MSSNETNAYFDDLSVAFSDTDLLQTDLDSSTISGFDPLATYAPSLSNGGNLYNGSPDSAILNDKYSRYNGEAYIDTSDTTEWMVEFHMDLSTNTLGYDITEINSFSGWGSGLALQDFTLEFSTVGSLSFTSIGRFTYSASNTTHVVSVFEDVTGILGSGVDVIRFTHHSGSGDARGSYRELDVLGSPTVIPEPGTAVLLVIAGLSAFCLRRNRSRRE
jgi:MprA protease rhombosortase-interaction domain-containing protein